MVNINISHLSSNTINGFTGGSTMMSLIGTIEIERILVTCSTLFPLNVPDCNPNQGGPETESTEEILPVSIKGNIVLYPNPAH